MVIVLSFPWIIYNLYHYGYPTANAIAKELQQKHINPNYDTYDIYFIINGISYLFATFWSPQEAILNPPTIMSMNFISVGLIIAIFYLAYKLMCSLKKGIDFS